MFLVSVIVSVVAFGLASVSGLWQAAFAKQYTNGQIDSRIERIDTESFTATQTRAERRTEFDLPLGRIFEKLFIRLRGTFTIGAANCTSLQPHGMQRAIRRVELELTPGRGVSRVYQGIVRQYNPRGINDAVGGRTASFAGIAMARENLIDNGTPVPQTDPGLNIGTETGEITLEVSFLNKVTAFPWTTLLDTNKVTLAKIRIWTGVLETTAAGDDTDIYVTAAGSTVAFAGDLILSGKSLVNVPALPFDVKLTRTQSEPLSVSSNLRHDIGENTYYRRILMHVTDNDVDSDVRVESAAWIQDNKDRVIDSRWYDLINENKGQFDIETWPTGFAVMTFDPYKMGRVQNLWGQHDADVELNVPAGAVAAADLIHYMIEEVRPHPMRNK
jgi:hypothetical protein